MDKGDVYRHGHNRVNKCNVDKFVYYVCSSAQLIRGHSGWREGWSYSSGGL